MGGEEQKMKSLTLSRKVELEKYELLMEIGRQEKREELNAILMLAKEQGGRVTAADVCNRLLIGRPEQVGKAILDRCRYFDLLDDHGRLTVVGRESLENGEVFVPERGRYILWYTDDPLFPSRVLNLEATSESPISNEIYQQNGYNDNAEKDTSENIPEKIISLEGRVFRLFGKSNGRIQIRKINLNGIIKKLDPDDQLQAQIILTPNQKTEIHFKGKFRIQGTRSDISFDDNWLPALGHYSDLWDNNQKNPALKTSFSKLGENEIFTFKKNLRLESPTLPNLGTFEDTMVEDVPIKPVGLTDAEKWATYILRKSIDTYLDQSQYQNLTKSIRSKFLDYPHLEIPSIKELKDEILKEKKPDGRLPREYWYLQAPIDLNEGGYIDE
jgi:hypothetical protein